METRLVSVWLFIHRGALISRSRLCSDICARREVYGYLGVDMQND